jgi:creatinine amidohydrolase/Fe(II)-dependent formamide hydrolase-like protein
MSTPPSRLSQCGSRITPDKRSRPLVAAGKTTVIYCGGATHTDGPVITTGKHTVICHAVAERVAKVLGNALVVPVNPYAPATAQLQHRSVPSGANVFGTISLTNETYRLVTKDVVGSVITTAGFKNAMIMEDHSQGQDALQQAANELDQEWKPKGVRVYWIDLAPAGKKAMSDFLTKHNIPENRPTDLHTRIDDASELMSIDRKLTRPDKLQDDIKMSSAEFGKAFVDMKVNAVVEQIRKFTAAGQ